MATNGKITMQAIAAELGVSRLTVSLVVNGRARAQGISEATIERIQAHLLERGYVPSHQARDLKRPRTDAVGILHAGHLYSHLIDAFNRLTDSIAVTPRRLEIMVAPRDRILDALRELLARGVSRLVWLHSLEPEFELDSPNVLNYLANIDTVVLYNYRFHPGDNSADLLSRGLRLVGVDRAKAFRELALFLKKLGHKSVATFGGEEPFREVGFDVEALRPDWSRGPVLADSPEVVGLTLAKETLKARTAMRVTALVVNDDEIAAYAQRELIRHGVKIPDDLTVVGFNGVPFASALAVPLTTLRMPVPALVERTERILDGQVSGGEHRLPMELALAESHAPRPRGSPPGDKRTRTRIVSLRIPRFSS